MNSKAVPRWPYAVALLALVAELAHLGWELSHGGVVSHNLLARPDLPAVSNAWGLLVLPALAWLASSRVAARMAPTAPGIAGRAGTRPAGTRMAPASIALAGFTGALLLGVLLSYSFSQGHPSVSALLFQGMFLLAVVLRVYRPECLLGFVLGMTLTFGAVLPTLIGSMVAAVSALVHLGVRPIVVWLWKRLRRTRAIAT